MLRDDNSGDNGGGTRKPTRPFLQKGEGTARFGTVNYGRISNGTPSREAKIPSAASPAISLPRFTPSSCLHPNSARTVDSGISNEDETRPPTTASLPMDPQTSEYNRNRTPIIVEENEDSGNYVEDEEVSAMQTFVPDEGASSIMAPNSQMSEEALNIRAKANQLDEYAKRMESMNSVSITPSSYSSNLSAPMYASTPIVESTQAPNSFHPPPRLPPNNHSYPFLSSSLETPQARPPLASNRINLMNQNVAQTGISLLNDQRSRSRSSQHQIISSSRENQKKHLRVSEHMYDQPFQASGFRSQECQNCLRNQEISKLNYNLMIQQRDAIAHLDYAEEGVRSTERELKEKYSKLFKKLESEIEKLNNRQKELEEEFQKKEETIQEDIQSEKENLKRERRNIERDRKMMQKGTDEQIGTLREKLTASETLNSKLRQDVRSGNDKLKKKDDDIEKLKQENTRISKSNQILEKHNRQLRLKIEQEKKEKQMFANGPMNRKSNDSQRHPPVSSLANNKQKTIANKRRSVSFADEHDEQSLEAMEETIIHPKLMMRACETVSSQFGPCTVYRDSLGEVTKVTETVANGLIFQYSNGDLRWTNRQNSVNIYRYGNDKTIMITLVPSNIWIIYSFQRQLEVLRPGNNVTLISLKLQEVRTELHCLDNGYCYTEIFKIEGRYLTTDGVQEVEKMVSLQDRYSERDTVSGTPRYVKYTTLDDFELIEPEFRLRWYQGKITACKIFGRQGFNEKTLGFHLDLKTGGGFLQEVENDLKDGKRQRKTVFELPAAAT